MMAGAVFGYMVSMFIRAPLVTTVHNSFDRHSILMRLGYRVVAVSEAERASLLASGYAPSSPSIALFRNGKLAYMLERSQIENRDALAIATELKAAFEQFCAPSEVTRH